MELELPMPPSINHYYRSIGRGRVVVSRAGRDYRKVVCALVLAARVQPLGKSLLAVSLKLYVPDRRRRDLDNVLKPVLDALQYAGVYVDDNQIVELRISKELRRGRGGLLVCVDQEMV